MRSSAFLSVALLIAAIGGCRVGGGGAAGYYRAVQVGRETESPPPLIDGPDLEIRGNGTFLVRVFPALEGKVETQGDLVILKIEKAGGKEVASLKGKGGKPLMVPPVRLRVAEGGSRLTPDAANQNPVKFTWVRAER